MNQELFEFSKIFEFYEKFRQRRILRVQFGINLLWNEIIWDCSTYKI